MNREKHGDVVDLMQKTGEEARLICVKLLEGADRSAIALIAFNQGAKVLQMQEEQGGHTTQYTRELQETAVNAVKVTLRSAWGCLRILYLINAVANKGNPQVTADLGVANLQSYSGAVGTCYSLNKNMEQIKDVQMIAEYRQEAGNLLQEAHRLYTVNLEMLEEVIKPEYPIMIKGGSVCIK